MARFNPLTMRYEKSFTKPMNGTDENFIREYEQGTIKKINLSKKIKGFTTGETTILVDPCFATNELINAYQQHYEQKIERLAGTNDE